MSKLLKKIKRTLREKARRKRQHKQFLQIQKWIEEL